jgi:hypothetical protein
MAHLAAAGGCDRVYTLYGPTSVNKNTHEGMIPIVAQGVCPYQACYTDKFSADGLACKNNVCMKSITIDRVAQEVLGA